MPRDSCTTSVSALTAGYGETLGESQVLERFEKYLAHIDLNPSQVKVTEEHLDNFLTVLTEQALRDDNDDGKQQMCSSCLALT